MTEARKQELESLIKKAKPGGVIPCEKNEFEFINNYLTDKDAWCINDDFDDYPLVITINPKDWKFMYGSCK